MQSLQQLRGGSAWQQPQQRRGACSSKQKHSSSRERYAPRRAASSEHHGDADASLAPSVSTLTDPEAKFHRYGRHYGGRFELSVADLMASAPRVRGELLLLRVVFFLCRGGGWGSDVGECRAISACCDTAECCAAAAAAAAADASTHPPPKTPPKTTQHRTPKKQPNNNRNTCSNTLKNQTTNNNQQNLVRTTMQRQMHDLVELAVVNERLAGRLAPWEARARLEVIKARRRNWEAIVDYVTRQDVEVTLELIEEANARVSVVWVVVLVLFCGSFCVFGG
jgi:hypothetical protein